MESVSCSHIFRITTVYLTDTIYQELEIKLSKADTIRIHMLLSQLTHYCKRNLFYKDMMTYLRICFQQKHNKTKTHVMKNY